MEFVNFFSGLFALTTYKWLNISQYSDLVGGIPSPVGMMNFPIYGKSQKPCSKPPTSEWPRGIPATIQ